MNQKDKTVVIAARILCLQYHFYARPGRAIDGSPMLFIWNGSSRDDVDLSMPDHSIRLSHSRLTWLNDAGQVVMGTLGGGKTLAEEVVKMIRSK